MTNLWNMKIKIIDIEPQPKKQDEESRIKYTIQDPIMKWLEIWEIKQYHNVVSKSNY